MPDRPDSRICLISTSFENSSKEHVLMNINIPTIYIICKYTVCQIITQSLAHCTDSGLDPTHTFVYLYAT